MKRTMNDETCFATRPNFQRISKIINQKVNFSKDMYIGSVYTKAHATLLTIEFECNEWVLGG